MHPHMRPLDRDARGEDLDAIVRDRDQLAIALGADGDLQPAVVVDGLASVGEDVQDGLLDGRAVDQDRRQGRELLVDRDPAPFDRVPDQVHRLVDERGQIGLRELGWTRAGEVT